MNHQAGMAPLYSIIVATFNRPSYLSNCLASLLAQKTHVSFEVVVVDDGSCDSTTEITQRYVHSHPRLFRVVRQEHKQLAAAKNLGVLSARGRIILFLDDDAIAPSNFLNKIDETFTRSDTDVLGFMDLPLPTDTYLAKGSRYLENFSRRFLKWKSKGRLKAHIAVKRDVLLRSGLFDESRGYRRAEDTELNYRLESVTSNMVFGHDICVLHRTRGFLDYVKASVSKLLDPKMLDVPDPFWYYRIHLGLFLMLVAAILPMAITQWASVSSALVGLSLGLLTFSVIVSLVSANTPAYGPAILMILIVRLIFIELYTLRFFAENVKRLFSRRTAL